MPLPILIDFPKSHGDIKTGMLEWSFSHARDHDDVRTAIQAQYNIILPQYQLDPMAFTNDSRFFLFNQQSHNDANAILGLSGTDIESIDFNDQSQITAWLWTHFNEHRAFHESLRI